MKIIDHKKRFDKKVINREFSRERKFKRTIDDFNLPVKAIADVGMDESGQDDEQDQKVVRLTTETVSSIVKEKTQDVVITKTQQLRANLARSKKRKKTEVKPKENQGSTNIQRHIASSPKGTTAPTSSSSYYNDQLRMAAVRQNVENNRLLGSQNSNFIERFFKTNKSVAKNPVKPTAVIPKSKTSLIKAAVVGVMSIVMMIEMLIVMLFSSSAATKYVPSTPFWDSSNSFSLQEVCREHRTMYKNSVINGAEIYADELIDEGWCYPYVLNGDIPWRNVISLYYAYVSDKDIENKNTFTSGSDTYQYFSEVFWASNCVCYDFNSYYEFETPFELRYIITEVPYQTEGLTFAYGFLVLCYHPDPYVVAAQLGFNDTELAALADYLDPQYDESFSSLESMIETGTGIGMIDVATQQVGNGWEPYCNWYTNGSGYRFPWCACFVSWCADQNGYIDSGVIPCLIDCVYYYEWFNNENNPGEFIYTYQNTAYQTTIEPQPGWLVIWEWDDNHSALSHIGIVESYDASTGYLITLEGNSSDQVRRVTNWRQYPEAAIWGFCIPAYPEELTAAELTSIDLGICEEYMWVAPVDGNNTIAAAALADNPVPQNMLNIAWEIVGILESGGSISQEQYDSYNASV